MKSAGRIGAEMLALCFAATIVGLVANALNAGGIVIGKNYFRTVVTGDPGRPAGSDSPAPVDEKDCIHIDEETGLQMACFRFVADQHDLMPDSDGFVVFVDARDDESYAEGHLPGALHVDHYQQDRYLPEVMPALQEAGVIIVYCTGGDCEDSKFLATALVMDHGLPLEPIYVYEGGIEEWKEKGKPLKQGLEP
jgi:rhodanese-related sulfurtransferase